MTSLGKGFHEVSRRKSSFDEMQNYQSPEQTKLNRKTKPIRSPVSTKPPFGYILLPNADVRMSYIRKFVKGANSGEVGSDLHDFLVFHCHPDVTHIQFYDGENPNGLNVFEVQGVDAIVSFWSAALTTAPDFLMRCISTQGFYDEKTNKSFICGTFECSCTIILDLDVVVKEKDSEVSASTISAAEAPEDVTEQNVSKKPKTVQENGHSPSNASGKGDSSSEPVTALAAGVVNDEMVIGNNSVVALTNTTATTDTMDSTDTAEDIANSLLLLARGGSDFNTSPMSTNSPPNVSVETSSPAAAFPKEALTVSDTNGFSPHHVNMDTISSISSSSCGSSSSRNDSSMHAVELSDMTHSPNNSNSSGDDLDALSQGLSKLSYYESHSTHVVMKDVNVSKNKPLPKAKQQKMSYTGSISFDVDANMKIVKFGVIFREVHRK